MGGSAAGGAAGQKKAQPGGANAASAGSKDPVKGKTEEVVL